MKSKNQDSKKIKLALPKGRLFEDVVKLLTDGGFVIAKNGRNYRPYIDDLEIEIKLLKPQNIPKLVELGSQDIAFTGYDWVVEENADVEELMDLKFNPVKLVAAVSSGLDINALSVVRAASEYESIAKRYLEEKGLNYVFIKSFGATESFIPEDADMIIDNASTGKTLEDNGLVIYDEVMTSSTRLIANKDAFLDIWKKKKIENLMLILKSVLEARKRLFIEMNVSKENLDPLIDVLPCMKSPTIAKLYADGGYAVKIAVEKNQVNELIPFLKEKGATDILVFELKKVVV